MSSNRPLNFVSAFNHCSCRSDGIVVMDEYEFVQTAVTVGVKAAVELPWNQIAVALGKVYEKFFPDGTNEFIYLALASLEFEGQGFVWCNHDTNKLQSREGVAGKCEVFFHKTTHKHAFRYKGKWLSSKSSQLAFTSGRLRDWEEFVIIELNNRGRGHSITQEWAYLNCKDGHDVCISSEKLMLHDGKPGTKFRVEYDRGSLNKALEHPEGSGGAEGLVQPVDGALDLSVDGPDAQLSLENTASAQDQKDDEKTQPMGLSRNSPRESELAYDVNSQALDCSAIGSKIEHDTGTECRGSSSQKACQENGSAQPAPGSMQEERGVATAAPTPASPVKGDGKEGGVGELESSALGCGLREDQGTTAGDAAAAPVFGQEAVKETAASPSPATNEATATTPVQGVEGLVAPVAEETAVVGVVVCQAAEKGAAVEEAVSREATAEERRGDGVDAEEESDTGPRKRSKPGEY